MFQLDGSHLWAMAVAVIMTVAILKHRTLGLGIKAGWSFWQAGSPKKPVWMKTLKWSAPGTTDKAGRTMPFYIIYKHGSPEAIGFYFDSHGDKALSKATIEVEKRIGGVDQAPEYVEYGLIDFAVLSLSDVSVIFEVCERTTDLSELYAAQDRVFRIGRTTEVSKLGRKGRHILKLIRMRIAELESAAGETGTLHNIAEHMPQAVSAK